MADEVEVVPDEILIPITGELIPLSDVGKVARALREVRDLKQQLELARRGLEQALVEEAQRQGTKTLKLSGVEATITGGQKLVWDQERLQELQELGLPAERYEALIKAVVEWKVDARVAKQIEASGNEDYARIIQSARSYEPAPYRVQISPGNC